MPVPVDQSRGGPDIGLVSLPVLCCLLGAALFVYEYGGSEPTLTREFLELEARLAVNATTAATVHDRAAEAEARLKLLAQAAELVREEQQLATLTIRQQNLAEQARLLEAARVQSRELTEARAEAAQLRAEQTAALAAADSLFGGYRGEFVLLECVEEAVVVHPSRRRIPLAELDGQREALLREIDRTGYVAIGVRPAGWREHSFEPVRQMIRAHLDAQTDHTIRWTEFPLQADESIEPFYPHRP